MTTRACTSSTSRRARGFTTRKPADLGNGRICASFDDEGAWLSLGAPHERHGFVELNALPRFDERERGDPAAVRRYRALMIDSRYAFLWLEAPGWRRTVSAHAPADRRDIEQLVALTTEGQPAPSPPHLCFRGRLDRPAFAEITEVSTLPPLHVTTTLSAEGRTLRIEALALLAFAEIRVSGSAFAWEIADDGARLALGEVAHASELEVRITCSLDGSP